MAALEEVEEGIWRSRGEARFDEAVIDFPLVGQELRSERWEPDGLTHVFDGRDGLFEIANRPGCRILRPAETVQGLPFLFRSAQFTRQRQAGLEIVTCAVHLP